MSLSTKTHKIAVTAILSAAATVLMFLSFPIPFLIPPFIKMDFSELPALLAAFSLGPVSGVMVCLVKNLINLLFTTTSGVGELCNFLLGICFVIPAGWIYQVRKTRSGALLAAGAPGRVRVGLKATGRGILREAQEVYCDGAKIGQTTSGTFAPYLKQAIAMALVDAGHAAPGTAVEVDVRGRRVAAEIVPLPFYKRA